MGPHSFKCGKVPRDRTGSTNPAWLQWGRTLSSAESRRQFQRLQRSSMLLQWGRTLSSAERKQPRQPCLQIPPASMGPHSFKCGKLKSTVNSTGLSCNASMGPHSFKCGKQTRHTRRDRRTRELQWGRTLSSAERSQSKTDRRIARLASMGPHSFKCGKNELRCRAVPPVQSFNGAALFQVRKVRWQCRRVV